MPSSNYKQLEREIALLRKQFLPDPFNPLGSYSKQALVQARTRAFAVLCHAEIETYIEGWAKEIARTAEQLWTAKQKISEPLLFLHLFLSDRQTVPNDLSKPGSKDSRALHSDLATKAFQRYYGLIRENHGIKEINVVALLTPIGVPRSAMGPTLLPSLSSFGALRGAYAHNSVRAIVNAPDPETDFKKAENIVADLQTLDAWLV